MRVAALVHVSAAIAAFPPAHARAVRNERDQGIAASIRMHVGTGALAGQWSSRQGPAGPLLHADCARAGIVEKDVSGEHVRANQSAPANPTLSLASPSSHSAGHRCPAHPSDKPCRALPNPAESCPSLAFFSWGSASKDRGAQRQRPWLIGPRAVTLAPPKYGRTPYGIRTRLQPWRWRVAREGARQVRHQGGIVGVAVAVAEQGSQTSCSGPTSEIASISVASPSA